MTQGWKYFAGLVIGVLALTLAFVTSATADTSSSADIVNLKIYGNCKVWTEVSMLTDEVLHALECKEEKLTDVASVLIIASGGGVLGAALSKGVMFHLGDTIPVAFRIDKGELRRGQWYWGSNGMYAGTRDEEIAQALLAELPKGRRIAIQVGEESGNVMLDGSAAAVKDFRSRISQAE